MSDGMQVFKLGDLGKILMCKRVLKHETSETGEIPFFKISTFGGTPDVFIPRVLYEKYKAKYPHPKKGDILISAAGTIGKTVVYDGKPAYFQDSNIVWLAHDESKVLNSYLRYYYLTEPWSPTDGSTIKRLYNENLRSIAVTVPSIEYQRKVASVLSALDDKIALNTRINAELEAMAKLLYDYWFVQFDFPNAKGKPYKSSGGAMVHNAELKREVPEGWEVKPLERMAHLIMGQSPKGASYNTEGKGMPLVNGAADYKNGMLAPETWTSEPTRTCIKDDLVFCSRATIGNLTIAEDTFCIGRCISAVRPNDTKASEFLYFGLLNELERFKRQAPGSIIKGITRDDLRDAPFLTPSAELLKRFHEAAFPMFQKIRLNKLENQELTTLRDWLLPMLMNGQVMVGEAEEKVELAMAAEGQAKYGSGKTPRRQ